MQENDSVVSEGADNAMRSVTTFLDGERARRRSARRTWFGIVGLVAGVGLLHGLTIAGLLAPEGRDIIASTSAVGLGLISQLRAQ